MHKHDRQDAATAVPRRSRTTTPADLHRLRAAAAGRPDVLGAAGLQQLQRLAGNEATGELVEEQPTRSPVLDVIGSGGGQPLDPDLRGEMEARLGHDFGDVRVHTDSAATESARAVNAHAYTVGSSVVFQRDHYDPSSTAGRTMLAHELTHVVQQRRGPVDGTETGTGVKVSDPQDRFEQEATATAEAAMAGPVPTLPTTAGSAGDGPDVQRDEVEHGEGLLAQRETEEEIEHGET